MNSHPKSSPSAQRAAFAWAAIVFAFQPALAAQPARAIDTSAIPRLTERDEPAIVIVIHGAGCVRGSATIVGRQSGFPVALTAAHVPLTDSPTVRLHDGTTCAAQVIARSKIKDICLLRLTTNRRLPTLQLARAGLALPHDRPVTAVAQAGRQVLQHVGTFQGMVRFNSHAFDARCVKVAAYTPPGFSGGAFLVVDPTSGESRMIGLVTRATSTESYGPGATEIRRFMQSAHVGANANTNANTNTRKLAGEGGVSQTVVPDDPFSGSQRLDTSISGRRPPSCSSGSCTPGPSPAPPFYPGSRPNCPTCRSTGGPTDTSSYSIKVGNTVVTVKANRSQSTP